MIQKVKHGARDQQRTKVYRAERAVFSWADAPDLSEVDDVRCYAVQAILQARPWCPAARVKRELHVKDGRRKRRATASTIEFKITVPRFMRRRWVVLHEVAHLLSNGDSHGPAFAGTMVCLVRDQFGPEVAAKLAASYDKEGVRR